MPLALYATLPRASGSSAGRRGISNLWRPRQLVAVGVGVILAVWVALAYASPPDPSWIPGMYDDRDFDDVVGMVTDAAGVDDAQVPRLPDFVLVSAVLPAVIDMTTNVFAREQTIRGPPTTPPGASDDFVLISASRRSCSVRLLPDPFIRNTLLPPMASGPVPRRTFYAHAAQAQDKGAAPEVQASRPPAAIEAGMTAERRDRR